MTQLDCKREGFGSQPGTVRPVQTEQGLRDIKMGTPDLDQTLRPYPDQTLRWGHQTCAVQEAEGLEQLPTTEQSGAGR